MKKILSIIVIAILICCSIGVQGLNFEKKYTEIKNSNLNDFLFDKNGKIYGNINYFNDSNSFNVTVLLWEGSPWGFSNLPDDITYTDSNGYYEFKNLSYGRYHINPAKTGFKIGEKNVFLSEENPERRVDFTAVKSEIYQQPLIILLFLLLLFLSK